MSGLRNFLHSTYKSAAEKVLPARQTSAFKEKGVLTPDEFVAAGDYLIRTCPTWSWEGGDTKKARPFLPPDKQFLITRNVPCLRRAAAVEEYGQAAEMVVEADAATGEEGWVTANAGQAAGPSSVAAAEGFEEIPSMSGGPSGGAGGTAGAGEEVVAEVGAAGEGEDEGHDSDVPDIADLELDDDEADAAALQPQQPAGGGAGGRAEDEHIVRTRTYDLLISYDKYYQVPRFWLVGYDEDRRPLTPDQVLEDVSEEHARKTITIEPHPHGGNGVQAASIHPCRHANVMHKLSEVVAGEGGEFRIEHYLVLFLKFIASIIPTIEYDYTMPAGAS